MNNNNKKLQLGHTLEDTELNDLSDDNFNVQIDSILNNKNNPEPIINKITEAESNLTIHNKDFVKLLKIISNLSNDNNLLKTELQNMKLELNKLKKANIDQPIITQGTQPVLTNNDEVAHFIDFQINSKLMEIMETFDKKIAEVDKKMSSYKSMYMTKKTLMPAPLTTHQPPPPVAPLQAKITIKPGK